MNQYILGLKEFASALIGLEVGDEIAKKLPCIGCV
ncbi:transcription elongation GreA/GreB family factor [Bosea sp. BE125]|nr:transcription elongation GreA/GreB family factor [Bosea sp. BE125]